MRTGRPRVRKDNAERIRICRLRKRARCLGSFYGNVLVDIYRKAGFNPDPTVLLPWVSWDEFSEAGGETDIRKLVALELPFVEIDRSQIDHPRIRIGGAAPKKEKANA